MIAAALLAAATLQATPAASPPPSLAAYRAALDHLYDGRADVALDQLTELGAGPPEDPLGVYLQALVLCWRLEQRPESAALDREFVQRVGRALSVADERLKRDPADVRARLARGAAHGVRSRFHMARGERGNAARDAVRMREDLMQVRALSPGHREALFGLGLYDYYADVLPRVAKVLRFLARMPGGDRARGLAMIEEARDGAALHEVEVKAQLYEIYAFYEERPDLALQEIRGLHRRYPGWPLWSLKLAEHLRDRLGDYRESAAVAAQTIAPPRRSGPVAVALARLSLGESLLLDLRPVEARRAVLPVKDGLPGMPALAARARLLLGRSLEMEGDRDGAEAHYRVAADATDRDTRRLAERALANPRPPGEVRALHFLGEARRDLETGREREAAANYRDALEAWPSSPEAALGVADAAIGDGELERARGLLRGLDTDGLRAPPSLRAWSHLLEGELLDLEGRREPAVQLYKKVLQDPCAAAGVKQRAGVLARTPFRRLGTGAGA
jgi:tetratricopeptide (TPR) repeat protein